MDLRTWLVDVTSGTVEARLDMAPGSTFTSVLGGGRMTGAVVASTLRNTDGTRATGALLNLVQSFGGGRHSILLTDGTETLGEWLVWGYERDHDSDVIPVHGFEWDDYPQYRSIHTDFKYKATDAGKIHYDALVDVFNEFQPNNANLVQITAPTFGYVMDLKTLPRTGYYSDILRDLDDLGLSEWRVVPTCTWVDGVPQKVTRTVRYQQPIITSSHPDRLVKAGDQDRHGNLTAFSRAYDMSRVAGTVIGWGAGKGKKQRYTLEQDGGWGSRGHIASTRNVHFPGTYSNTELSKKTRAVLDTSKDPWEPTNATIDGTRISTPPVIGGVHDVHVAPSWAFPEGGQWRMRVGEITWRTDSTLIDVEMEEVS